MELIPIIADILHHTIKQELEKRETKEQSIDMKTSIQNTYDSHSHPSFITTDCYHAFSPLYNTWQLQYS